MARALASASGRTWSSAIRRAFPALERTHNGLPVAYFDGPGGTQVPRAVVDAMADGKITKEEALLNADSASNLSTLVDFSERTNTAFKIPAFDPSQMAQQNTSDLGGIKLNLDDPK